MTIEEFKQSWRITIDGYIAFLANPKNPMRRVGVNLTDEQKTQIQEMAQVGNRAGAQRLILDILDEEESRKPKTPKPEAPKPG